MTQNAFLKRYLNDGNTITPTAARNFHQIQNLRARINELRQNGVFVVTGKNFFGETEYSLARPNKNFISLAYKLGGGSLFRESVVKSN